VTTAVFWSAFVELDGSRAVGMDVSPIPPSEVLAWCAIRGFTDGEMIEDIWQVVHMVDLHRMARMREKSERDAKADEAKRKA